MAEVRSGSFTTTAASTGRSATFSWSLTSQNIENNYSTISWTFKGAGSGTSWNNTQNSYVNINGQKVWTQAAGNTVQLRPGTQLAAGSLNIYHDSNGAKTFSADAGAGIYIYGTIQKGSGSWTLPTIPRASDISVTPTTIDTNANSNGTNAVTIKITAKGSSFTHKVSYNFAGKTGTISGTGTSITWKPLDSLFADLPNSSSSTCMITLDTLSNGNVIGSKSTSITINLRSGVVPTLDGSTVADGNTTISGKGFGLYLIGKSYPVLTYTSPSGVQKSTITTYYCTINSVEYSATSVANLNTAIKNVNIKSGTNSLTMWVKDSRGRISAKKSASFTGAVYNPPIIEIFNIERCNSSGTEIDNGTYGHAYVKASITSLSSKNTLKCTLKWKERTVTTWGTPMEIQKESTTASINFTGTSAKVFGAGGLSATKSYDFQLDVTDKLGTISVTTTISSEFDLVHYHKSGKSIAFGKKSEAKDTEKKLEVAMDAYFEGAIYLDTTKLFWYE